MRPLEGIQLLTLAVNLPGPTAAARLCGLGATVVKVEPPAGDPLAHARPRWYEELHQGQTVLTLDLKEDAGWTQLDHWLDRSDLLLTAMRPAALQRLGLDWPALHARRPRLCHVAIVGHPAPQEDRPGHDLTYQALAGLVEPPRLPRGCLADATGAQQAVSRRPRPAAGAGTRRGGRVRRGFPGGGGGRVRGRVAARADHAGRPAGRRLAALRGLPRP